MARRMVVALATLLLSWPLLQASAEGTGTITGKVIKFTAGGESVANLEVVLHLYAGDIVRDTVIGRTDDEGNFQIMDVPLAPGDSYHVSTLYQGVRYASELMAFQEGEAAKPLEIIVYDTTTSDADIRVQRAHLVMDVDMEHQVLYVLEFYFFYNAGDKAYIGTAEGVEGQPTLRFTLPEGAVAPEFDSSQMASLGGGVLAYTAPVLPGMTEVVFRYTLEYGSASTRRIPKLMDYPTDRLDVMMADVGPKLSSQQLVPEEPVEVAEKRYLHLSGENIPAKTHVNLLVSGLTSPFRTEDVVKWLVPALIVLGLGGGLARVLVTRPPVSTPVEGHQADGGN